MNEASTHLSPDGRWAVMIVVATSIDGILNYTPLAGAKSRIVAEAVPVISRDRQWLISYQLDGDRPPRILHETTRGDGWLDDHFAVILDDGTVLAVREDGSELHEWRPDGTLLRRPLFETFRQIALYLRPDGRALVILDLPDPDDDDSKNFVSVLDLATRKIDRRALDINYVCAWTRDLACVIASAGLDRIFRIDMNTYERETIFDKGPFENLCSSNEWIVWREVDGPIWRMSTARDAKPIAVPELAVWRPVISVDDQRFLCCLAGRPFSRPLRHAIVDILDNSITEVPAPPGGFAYSRALDAFVVSKDLGCEVWNLDGTLRTSSHPATSEPTA